MHTKTSFLYSVKEIFTTKKNINSKILNILGIQIFRYLLAKIIFFISKFFFKDNKILKRYEDNGTYLIENFLPENIFQKAHEEFNKIMYIEKKSRNVYKNLDQNSSIVYYLYEFEDNYDNKQKYPYLYEVFKSTKINDFFKYAEKKKNINLFMRLERVITKNELKNDDNAHWHVDTYHNTHKAWIYLTDVKKENGPYNYVVGSNKFSIERIFWEYLNSVKAVFIKNYLPFFTFDKHSEKLEKKKIEIRCNKNSFFITNTHGYHRRGDSKAHQVRDAINFFTRENPFKVF
jgi:ectoine hydroxylase-related dioxygenase (phytanoyl-CoA dioxygenase family)